MRAWTRTAALLLLAASMLPSPAGAQGATEARLREALRTTTAQLRAAEDERARLAASEAALKEELAAAKAQSARRANPREVDDLKAKLADASQKLAAETEAGRKSAQALAECQAASQDTSRARDGLQGDVAALRERVAAAEAKNARMYAVGREIIDWLSNMGFGAALAARDPFLGLKRVELENAAQDYDDKLLDQKLAPGGTSR